MKWRSLFVTLVSAGLLPSFALGQSTPANIALDAPIYEGARFLQYADMDNGVVVASYCSSAPQNLILKFYRSAFKNALEIQVSSSGSPINKILLDVSSPSDWRSAKKFIEIYEDKKTSECSSIMRITTKRKETDIGKPLITTGKKEVENLQDKAIPSEISRRKTLGFGGYINTINLSAGPTLIVWPSENFALQGSYGAGTYTSYEARGFYRFNPLSRLKPYFGAGYIHADKQATVIGVDTTISGDSFSVFGGIETVLYKNLYLYADVSATPIKLEKDVRSSTQRATVTVDYTPVTVGAGVVFYVW